MKTRLSIDTDFEFYRAIIARTQNSIADDDFIVHRGDINKPVYWLYIIREKIQIQCKNLCKTKNSSKKPFFVRLRPFWLA